MIDLVKIYQAHPNHLPVFSGWFICQKRILNFYLLSYYIFKYKFQFQVPVVILYSTDLRYSSTARLVVNQTRPRFTASIFPERASRLRYSCE